LTTCFTACRNEVTTQSARVAASASGSSASCAVNVQKPSTIFAACGSRRYRFARLRVSRQLHRICFDDLNQNRTRGSLQP
jgi:hypothetical protein